MAIPNNKEELILAIVDNYTKLIDELSTIPIEQTTIVEIEGHSKNTKMSINNLISYLIGWGQLVLKWNDKKSKGQIVDFPETGYKWNELGKLANHFYREFEDTNFNTLLIKLEETTDEIIKLVQSKTNKELYETTWYEKWTLGRMIQLNTASPFKNAKARIRKWKKKKDTI